ncbi:hypothetical protein PIB30_066166 [Stylosanthes scabra]|uniref:Uncharacterized protein n=1 Tax=Stylosanthes scabra TaxID=79078 RepID=A0ABU6WKL1_9FABA|nr:hypothetical protein [Stylosanthes scabra]
MEGQHHSLKELQINNSCYSVTSFSLDAFPNLVLVYILNCENMESVMVSLPGCLSCLQNFKIEDCGSLKSVSKVWMAAPQLQHLRIVGCPEMDLSATGDPHRILKSLYISYYERLVSSAAFINSQFQGLTHLTIHGECESVKCLPIEGWLPASLESLTPRDIKSVEKLECKGLAHLTSLQKLCIDDCPKLENIEGEKLHASLIQLTIYKSPLLSRRCEMKDPQTLRHGSWDMTKLGASSKLDSDIPFEYSAATLFTESYSLMAMPKGDRGWSDQGLDGYGEESLVEGLLCCKKKCKME